MYLSIQLAFSGASTSRTGALIILCLDRISIALARVESEGISTTDGKDSKLECHIPSANQS